MISGRRAALRCRFDFRFTVVLLHRIPQFVILSAAKNLRSNRKIGSYPAAEVLRSAQDDNYLHYCRQTQKQGTEFRTLFLCLTAVM